MADALYVNMTLSDQVMELMLNHEEVKEHVENFYIEIGFPLELRQFLGAYIEHLNGAENLKSKLLLKLSPHKKKANGYEGLADWEEYIKKKDDTELARLVQQILTFENDLVYPAKHKSLEDMLNDLPRDIDSALQPFHMAIEEYKKRNLLTLKAKEMLKDQALSDDHEKIKENLNKFKEDEYVSRNQVIDASEKQQKIALDTFNKVYEQICISYEGITNSLKEYQYKMQQARAEILPFQEEVEDILHDRFNQWLKFAGIFKRCYEDCQKMFQQKILPELNKLCEEFNSKIDKVVGSCLLVKVQPPIFLVVETGKRNAESNGSNTSHSNVLKGSSKKFECQLRFLGHDHLVCSNLEIGLESKDNCHAGNVLPKYLSLNPDANGVQKLNRLYFEKVKKAKRANSEENISDSVYRISFKVLITFMGKTHRVETYSEPLGLGTNSSQACAYYGTIFWMTVNPMENRFGIKGKIEMSQLMKAINKLFETATGRGLNDESKEHLMNRCLKQDGNDEDKNKDVVSWQQFLKPLNSSVWRTVFSSVNFLKKDKCWHGLKSEWCEELIFGFISKEKATAIVNEMPVGTAIVRFRDTFDRDAESKREKTRGCISLSLKTENDVVNYVKGLEEYNLEKYGLFNMLKKDVKFIYTPDGCHPLDKFLKLKREVKTPKGYSSHLQSYITGEPDQNRLADIPMDVGDDLILDSIDFDLMSDQSVFGSVTGSPYGSSVESPGVDQSSCEQNYQARLLAPSVVGSVTGTPYGSSDGYPGVDQEVTVITSPEISLFHDGESYALVEMKKDCGILHAKFINIENYNPILNYNPDVNVILCILLMIYQLLPIQKLKHYNHRTRTQI